MFKFLIILVVSLFISQNSNGQNYKKEYPFQKSFSELSENNIQFEVKYSSKKETLYFEISENDEILKKYQTLIKDIHPNGIFLFEKEGKNYIRILSINNGTVFIKYKFINGFSVSNTIKYVDIEITNPDYGTKEKLSKFIYDFKNFIKLKNVENKKEVKIENIRVFIDTTNN